MARRLPLNGKTAEPVPYSALHRRGAKLCARPLRLAGALRFFFRGVVGEASAVSAFLSCATHLRSLAPQGVRFNAEFAECSRRKQRPAAPPKLRDSQ